MIQTDKSYVYGTAAEKLKYNDYEENIVQSSEKKVKRVNNKSKLKVVCIIAIVFAACFILMLRYALITELSYSIDNSKIEYNKLKNANSIIKVENDKNMDLQQIKETAENRLGMHKPDKYQKVEVWVPKNDYTKVADTYESQDNASSGMFAVLMDKVGKIAQLLN